MSLVARSDAVFLPSRHRNRGVGLALVGGGRAEASAATTHSVHICREAHSCGCWRIAVLAEEAKKLEAEDKAREKVLADEEKRLAGEEAARVKVREAPKAVGSV